MAADRAAGMARHRISPRKLLARHLVGSGLEVGPGHHPFALPLPGVEVAFVDRWSPEEGRDLFPQMGPYAEQPDVKVDFNTDRLGPIPDASQDFVIASHVLEHLAEPLGFIADIHRVLRPGGIALILLPDRHHTRDRNREPTPLKHLVTEYHDGVQETSDDHLIEFLHARGQNLPESAAQRTELLDRYRLQSVHVHCWDAEEFLPVILWGIGTLEQQWEFVDGCLPFDGVPPADIEFGYVLRRSDVDLDAKTRAQRFEASWTAWHDAQLRMLPATTAVAGLTRAYGQLKHGLYRHVYLPARQRSRMARRDH